MTRSSPPSALAPRCRSLVLCRHGGRLQSPAARRRPTDDAVLRARRRCARPRRDPQRPPARARHRSDHACRAYLERPEMVSRVADEPARLRRVQPLGRAAEGQLRARARHRPRRPDRPRRVWLSIRGIDTTPIDYAVSVVVLRFEPQPDGTVALNARWTIRDGPAQVFVNRESQFERPAGTRDGNRRRTQRAHRQPGDRDRRRAARAGRRPRAALSRGRRPGTFVPAVTPPAPAPPPRRRRPVDGGERQHERAGPPLAIARSRRRRRSRSALGDQAPDRASTTAVAVRGRQHAAEGEREIRVAAQSSGDEPRAAAKADRRRGATPPRCRRSVPGRCRRAAAGRPCASCTARTSSAVPPLQSMLPSLPRADRRTHSVCRRRAERRASHRCATPAHAHRRRYRDRRRCGCGSLDQVPPLAPPGVTLVRRTASGSCGWIMSLAEAVLAAERRLARHADDDLTRLADQTVDVAHTRRDDGIAGRKGPRADDRQAELQLAVGRDESELEALVARAGTAVPARAARHAGAVVDAAAEIIDGVEHRRIVREQRRIEAGDAADERRRVVAHRRSCRRRAGARRGTDAAGARRADRRRCRRDGRCRGAPRGRRSWPALDALEDRPPLRIDQRRGLHQIVGAGDTEVRHLRRPRGRRRAGARRRARWGRGRRRVGQARRRSGRRGGRGEARRRHHRRRRRRRRQRRRRRGRRRRIIPAPSAAGRHQQQDSK